jgi:predicted benzoate:H+ symporter BenE
MGHGSHSSQLGDNFYAVSSSLILVWLLLAQIPDSLPSEVVNSVVVCVLFVCKCVLYYCHRVSTQLQLTNISHVMSYHIISYHIISYHIISYHIISYIISYHISSYHMSYHISYIISYHFISFHFISMNILPIRIVRLPLCCTYLFACNRVYVNYM